VKKFNITVNGNAYEVEIEEVKAAAPVAAAPKAAPAAAPAPKAAPAAAAAAPAAGDNTVTAPMPGKIVKLVGQAVNAGDVLLILEAMKMQNEITAPAAGTVKSFAVNAGDSVKPGQTMVVIG
jgi:biotin carboxyl carrier protein